MGLNRWLTTGAALLTLAAPPALQAQTLDALKADGKTPGDVLTYGMGYSNQRYSALKQINTQTVANLTPAWSYSLNKSPAPAGATRRLSPVSPNARARATTSSASAPDEMRSA